MSSPTCSRRSRCGPTTIAGYCRRAAPPPETRKAALIFLKFLWDHNFDWARGGGHLPARQSLMAEYAKLPLRQYVVDIPSFGHALPHEVRRQFGFQNMIGEEIANIINTGKTAEQAADAAQERSVALLRGR